MESTGLASFDKVRGEWSLMALCYNFTRILNILGFDGFVAALAAKALALLRHVRIAAPRRVQLVLATFWANIVPPLAIRGPTTIAV